MAQFETIPQCLLFFLLLCYIYLRKKRDLRLTYLLIAFVSLYSVTGSSSPRCTFIRLKACNQSHIFTLDIIYVWDELVSYHFSLICKFYTISKFERINNKSFQYIHVTLTCIQDLFIIVGQMNGMYLKGKEST